MAADLLFDLPPNGDGALLFGEQPPSAGGVPYVPSAALVFIEPAAADASLVFALEPDDGNAGGGDVPVRVDLVLPGPTVSVRASMSTPARVSCVLSAPAVVVVVRYASNTQRPLVGQAATRWQDAAHRQATAVEQRWKNAQHLHQGAEIAWGTAVERGASTGIRWRDAQRAFREGVGMRYQDGVPMREAARSTWRDALRFGREGVAVRFQQGLPMRRGVYLRFQQGLRNRGEAYHARYQAALALPALRLKSTAGDAVALNRGWGTRYQDAKQPTPGVTVFPSKPPEPPFDPCYTPDPALLFQYPWADFADGKIVFFCDKHGDPVDPEPPTVVVPVRRIYTVINSAMLRRVDGNVLIPNTAMSLAIDVDSWTWGFTARVPGAALPDLEPVGGEPVEVEATINGIPYRAIVEGISRERVFGRSDLTITGRGKAAVLDSPYSAFLTFGNPTNDRTVQQLANDVLSLNGVSIGWDVDAGWKPDDWLVPAGAWSFQGSHMAALNAIAAAAGAYVQPHRTDKALSVLRRYPVAPWDWGDVTPDFELPSDVVQKEGMTWSDKAIYNRVFVRGMKSGILGQATRLGTAGDLEAPMVTDQLITNAIGARQRALPVLADVGRQAAVSLRLPVLAETGIIPPGKFVRYVDGGVTRIGLVRSVAAEVQRADKNLTVWQTIGVETHV